MSQYATTAALALEMSAKELVGLATDKQTAALIKASQFADGYLGNRYTLPLSAYGSDLTRCVVDIAAYDLLCSKPVNPPGQQWNREIRYRDAVKWLEAVASQKISPVGIVDSTPASTTGTDGNSTVAGKVIIQSAPSRGW